MKDRHAESWRRYWKIVGQVDPGVRSPEDLFFDRVMTHAHDTRWMDAGCGRRTFPRWRADGATQLKSRGVSLFGCDADVEALREREDAGSMCAATLEGLPFRDETFGLVTSNMVFEHLDDAERCVAELVRVTKRGGRILVHTVNRRHYLAWIARATPYRFHRWLVHRVENRLARDVYPTRYRANTLERLRSLFETHGCRISHGGPVHGIPIHLPYPGLFWLGIAAGLAERRLARVPFLGSILTPNLLLEFERTC